MSRPVATFITFLVSSIAHELVMGCITRKFRGYGFVAMMLQMPIVLVQRSRWIRNRTILNNVLFWCSMILGLSMVGSILLSNCFLWLLTSLADMRAVRPHLDVVQDSAQDIPGFELDKTPLRNFHSSVLARLDDSIVNNVIDNRAVVVYRSQHDSFLVPPLVVLLLFLVLFIILT